MKKEKKALSIRQPWAWFIVNGYKDIENRSWKPSAKMLGEKILIHAGVRRLTKEDFPDFLDICKDEKIKKHPKSIDDFHYGYLVGSATIGGVSRNSKSSWAFRGQYHWEIKDAKKMKPKKQKGQLSFFKVKV